MSLILDDEKYDDCFNVPHAPPVRKLFSPAFTENGEANIHEIDTFRVFLRIKPNSKLDNSVSFYISELKLIASIRGAGT